MKLTKKSLLPNKRGNIWVNVLLGFGIGIISVAILAIVISALKGTQTVGTVSYSILNNTETFMLNSTNQLGTSGTVLGIMALVVIVGIFGFMGYQKIGGGSR